MDMPTKLLALGLIVTAGTLVTVVLRILGAWTDHHIRRHDLIAESKRRRLDYFRAVAQRQTGSSDSVELME